MQLELFNFEKMKETATSSDLDILGMRHIRIDVDNVDNKYEELKSNNVDIDEPKIGITCAKFCFLRDPNGISYRIVSEKRSNIIILTFLLLFSI